jgi:transcriptional regulator with XRE-family HTH domain
MREINHHIGAMIRANRKNRGLRQEQLAELLGVSKSAVSQYESGKGSLNVATLAKVAYALGCNIEIKMTPIENS